LQYSSGRCCYEKSKNEHWNIKMKEQLICGYWIFFLYLTYDNKNCLQYLNTES
jgi:hypothetical protein